MKNNTIKYSLIAFTLVTTLFAGANRTFAQRVIKIGEAEIAIQSPITIKKQDTLNYYSHVTSKSAIKKRATPKYPQIYDEFFFGLGTMIPFNREEFIDIHYGRINTIELGYKYFYRPSRGYAIGSTFQYTNYNYKLRDAAQEGIIVPFVPGYIKKEYFRSDNIGTGLINRFYLFPKRNPFILDLGGYVDFSFSKRYIVKSSLFGKTDKFKYRDGSKFNPLQAGLYGAISKGDYSVYVRYRLTNMFNPLEIQPELPKLSVGFLFNW